MNRPPLSDSELHADIVKQTGGDSLRLENFGYKIHSQSDEDGILDEIFRRIGTTNRVFVEIGVEVGTECNTLRLLEDGWSGMWLEGVPDYVNSIRWSQRERLKTGQLKLAGEFVKVATVNALIEAAGITGEIDIFSLDIDSNDYHVLEALTVIQPRVIMLEHNHVYEPPKRYIMPRNDDFQWNANSAEYGASLESLTDLARLKGYTLVGCGLYSPNSFHVRNDLLGEHFKGPYTPEHFWNPVQVDKIFTYPRRARERHPVPVEAQEERAARLFAMVEQAEHQIAELTAQRDSERRAHQEALEKLTTRACEAEAKLESAETLGQKQAARLVKLEAKVVDLRDHLERQRSKCADLKQKLASRGRLFRGWLGRMLSRK